MRQTRFFQFLAILGTVFFLISSLLILHQRSSLKIGQIVTAELITQNTYLGPTSRTPGSSKLIRVEVLVNDDPTLGGVEIKEARFNNTAIPLKPRDISGFRGGASFQLPPGKYKLTWTVNLNNNDWPKTAPHEELVTLDPKDLWVQILIIGEEASIR